MIAVAAVALIVAIGLMLIRALLGPTLVAASVAWIKVCNGLAGSGLTSQYLSRKLVHMGSGPLFILMWPIFSTTPSGQLAAVAVPILSIIRLLAAGNRKDGGQVCSARPVDE